MRVDTQVHIVSGDRAKYPINPPTTLMPGGVDTHWYDDPALAAEDLLGRMDAAGIDRTVLVSAFSAYQYDNRYTVDAAAAHPDRLASVCIVDVDNDPITAMRSWVREGGARGIRVFLRNTEAGWLARPAADAFFDEVAELGVIGQVLAYPADLPQLLEAAGRHPDVPILVDHCANPDLSGGSPYPNAGSLFALSDAPNIFIKLASHVFTRAVADGSSHRDITERVVSVFGAARVMWASDHSIVGRVYADCVREAELACEGLSDKDRALVLGDAAASLWWPEAT